MAPFNLAETDRLLSTTRAVRKRLDLTRDVPVVVLRAGDQEEEPSGPADLVLRKPLEPDWTGWVLRRFFGGS